MATKRKPLDVKAFEEIREKLTFRERTVIKLLYGIEIQYIYSTEEVARIMKVPRTRVLKIEKYVLMKIRHRPKQEAAHG